MRANRRERHYVVLLCANRMHESTRVRDNYERIYHLSTGTWYMRHSIMIWYLLVRASTYL